MMRLTTEEIRVAAGDGIKALKENPDKNRALVYPQGFVPNAYGWPAPGQRVQVMRTEAGFETTVQQYDRKRTRGVGGYITLWVH